MWLKLWVFTFWYHDKEEIEFRFIQMINVLDQVKNHEMELINSLFKVLVENNVDDNLILQLYQKIIKLRINPTQFIFDIIKKIIENIEKNNNQKIKLIDLLKYDIQINYKNEKKYILGKEQ